MGRRALVSRAQRSTSAAKWCAADPGSLRSVAVPDQRCTAPLRYALHRVRDTEAADAFGALFTFQTAPVVPAAHFFAPGVCIVASLTRIEGWAERRETFGCSGTRSACT